MKKLFVGIGMFALCTTSSFAVNVDNSLEDAVDSQKTVEKILDIKMKNFSSCQNMEEVLEGYIKDYYEVNKDRYHRRYFGVPEMMEKGVEMENTVQSMDTDIVTTSNAKEPTDLSGDDFSKTNTQVDGVDEGDIVKTDGNYIYYYSEKYTDNKHHKYLYIVSMKTQKVVKKLSIPKSFSSPEFYIKGNNLVVLATMYNYNTRSYTQRNKTIAAIYNLGDREHISLVKLYAVDGSLSKSRLVGDNLYIVGEKYFDVPFYDIKSVDSIDIKAKNILPTQIDVTLTSDTTKQNVGKLPYHATVKKADCSSIDYNFPTKETLKNADFSASFTILSHINLAALTDTPETKILAGRTDEIYMNKDNIYFTSSMYNNEPFFCRGFGCIVPSYTQKANTLIHKYGLTEGYKTSALVPGLPLTQYSMDEHKGNFRILTKIDNWFGNTSDRYTNLYILDKDLQVQGKLTKLGTGEEFKSSRYMGDKLYLVTFERTDPLFVIDVKNPSAPTVLGELKIPGYSTYLHPYDEKHLIGLGFDTVENQWGGIQNAGIKLDMYEIHYDKKCGDNNLTVDEQKKCDSGDYKGIIAKQKYTKTFGGKGSASEATYNPRMFMWNAAKKKLFLPVQLRDYDDSYQSVGNFQGLLSLSIDKDTGINEDYRVDHLPKKELEAERKKKCTKYIEKAKQCKTLLDGTQVCGNPDTANIPNYCYQDATIYDYVNQSSWRNQSFFINRALWIGNNFFSLSPEKVQGNSIETGEKVMDVELK